MLRSSRSSTLIALAAVVTLASSLSAQTSVEFGPVLAYYRPTGHFEPASVYSTALPKTPADLSGMAWGGEARLWFGRRLGVQGQAAVASSTIGEVIAPGGPRGPTPAQVLTLTGQVLYDLFPTGASHRLWLSAGSGLVRHGGKAYAEYGSPTHAAGVLGLASTMLIAPRTHVAFGVTALFYQFDLAMPTNLSKNPGSLERGFQRDALVHLGVTWGRP